MQVDLGATIVTDGAAETRDHQHPHLVYTSLPGTGTTGNPTGSDTPGGSGGDTGERDGSDGTTAMDDYTDTAPATVTVSSPSLEKTIVATSQPSTGSEAGTDLNDPGIEDVAVGETVTYQLIATLPEGMTPTWLRSPTPCRSHPGCSAWSARRWSRSARASTTDGRHSTPPVTSVGHDHRQPSRGPDGFDDQVVFDFAPGASTTPTAPSTTATASSSRWWRGSRTCPPTSTASTWSTPPSSTSASAWSTPPTSRSRWSSRSSRSTSPTRRRTTPATPATRSPSR